MVQMVFVYSPVLLIVIDGYFTWPSFLSTTLSCAVGVFMVAASVAGYFLTVMPGIVRIAMALAGILLVAPGLKSDIYAVIVFVPVLAQQLINWKKNRIIDTEEN